MTITQTELESYLWGAATLLRGTIDAGDYKQFIFPLLFYKRLCDVYDEERGEALEESGGDEEYARLPELHRFQIPPEAHWSAVRSQVENVGKAIQDALREIERSNPDTLYGVFGDAAWTNKDRLPDYLLRELIEHFSSRMLSVSNLPEDELGVGYEYLIKMFADDSGHTAAEFYTNRTVVHLMTEMLEPEPGESIYDPTCGSAGMLLSAVSYLRNQGREWRNLGLCGQERNLLTSSIGKMNLFLHGIEDFEIVRSDTLAHPAFVEGDHLRRFDVVLANPPYSIKQWDRAAWSADPWGRNVYGTPPQGRADFAFWQHILKSMKPGTGRCAILFPHGVLFRNEERTMREKIVKSDVIECVLGLGPNLFYNSPMEACVVVCRTDKPPVRRGKILFVNAVNEVTRERAQSFLTDFHIEKIVSAYRAFDDLDSFARVATNDEVIGKSANLSIPLYVRSANGDTKSNGQGVSLQNAIAGWLESSEALRASMDELFDVLEGVQTTRGPQVISPSVKNHWTKVAFGDVVRNANLTEHDPEAAGLDRIVGLEHLDPENLHIRRWNTLENSTSFSRKFVPGQTLFGKRRAYQRKVAFAEFEGICSGDILTFEPEDPDVLLPELLPFICQTDAFFEHALGTSAGSLSPRTSWRALQDFEFPLPPIEEQKRIAEILWAADEVSERHPNTLAWVERLQRVAMAESFRRDSSNLTLRAATDVCEKITVGIVIKPASYYVKDGGIPALRSLNVFSQRFDLQELVYISEEGHSKNQKSELHSGDVVIVRTGRPGDACVIRAEQAGFNAIDLIIARPGKDILPDYLSAFVNSDLAKRQFNRGIAGTAQTHFNIGEFKKLKIPMVSVDKQGELLRDLQAIQTITSDISKHLLATQQLKRTLLNSLLWQASDV